MKIKIIFSKTNIKIWTTRRHKPIQEYLEQMYPLLLVIRHNNSKMSIRTAIKTLQQITSIKHYRILIQKCTNKCQSHSPQRINIWLKINLQLKTLFNKMAEIMMVKRKIHLLVWILLGLSHIMFTIPMGTFLGQRIKISYFRTIYNKYRIYQGVKP